MLPPKQLLNQTSALSINNHISLEYSQSAKMKTPSDYISEQFSKRFERKIKLPTSYKHSKRINGFPPNVVGGAGEEFFCLKTNDHYLGRASSPQWLWFKNTPDGQRDAWACLRTWAEERGDHLQMDELKALNMPKKEPIWKYLARRKTTRLQLVLQEMLGDMEPGEESPADTPPDEPATMRGSRKSSERQLPSDQSPGSSSVVSRGRQRVRYSGHGDLDLSELEQRLEEEVRQQQEEGQQEMAEEANQAEIAEREDHIKRDSARPEGEPEISSRKSSYETAESSPEPEASMEAEM